MTYICVNHHWFNNGLSPGAIVKHYPNQCWLVINWTNKDNFQWNLNPYIKCFFPANVFENFVCNMPTILFRAEFVNGFPFNGQQQARDVTDLERNVRRSNEEGNGGNEKVTSCHGNFLHYWPFVRGIMCRSRMPCQVFSSPNADYKVTRVIFEISSVIGDSDTSIRLDDLIRNGWQGFQKHDDVTKWKHFPRYWPFVGGNSPVTGEFPAQRPVTRSFDVFFDLRLNKRFSKLSWGWWFQTQSLSLCRHCNESCGTLSVKITLTHLEFVSANSTI